MVTKMNAEQALAGEASSSRRKRPRRLPSFVEDEAEPVVEEGENGGGTTATGNRNVAGDEVITEARSGTLFDLDLLDCPVCCHALAIPIFQCDNGHIACSSCCMKLRSKCPACTLPIGNYRCRIMERVVEAIIVPCPNAKHGCTEKFSYGKELVHEKKCGFALCCCPAPGCNYTGVAKDLYRHYDADHSEDCDRFTCGSASEAWVLICDKILVLQEFRRDGPLVVVQCFKEAQGFCVTVNCIAPSAPGVGEFSCNLSYSYGGKTMTFGLEEINRIQKVSFEIPEEDFMLIPYYALGHSDTLNMEICIRRLAEEEEEEVEAEAEEEEGEAGAGAGAEAGAGAGAEAGAGAGAEEEEEHDETEVVEKVRRSTRERKAYSNY